MLQSDSIFEWITLYHHNKAFLTFIKGYLEIK